MDDSTFEKEGAMNEHTDNMSQDGNLAEEALANELNTDDSVSGMQHLDDEVTEENEYEKLQAELSDAKDKYLRLVAEFDNFRRRNAKERIELTQTAGRDIMQALLDVVDDSERAAKQMETSTDIATIKEGIALVFNKLHHTLQQKGLRKMESIGQPFDPDMHEAITEIPAPDEMKGKVMDVVQPGYYLNDKLIRYAKVVVGK